MRKSKTKIRWLGALMALGLAWPAAAAQQRTRKSIELPADNPMATLKGGVGVEVARANCAICHSTDYIVRQAGGNAAHWRPEVEKMIKVYGAPVSDSDAETIVKYLAAAYGGKAADSPALPPRRQR